MRLDKNHQVSGYKKEREEGFPWWLAAGCCCCQVASVVSDSVQPHRRQPTRLPCPWESPGKNAGVGCHLLLQGMEEKSESEFAQLCPTLSDPMERSLPGSSVHGIFQARVLEQGAIAFSVHGGLVVKNSPASTGDLAAIPDLKRSYMLWSNYAHALQLLSLCSRAQELQLLSPHTTAPGTHTP